MVSRRSPREWLYFGIWELEGPEETPVDAIIAEIAGS
jgi:hypothetical protein